MAAKRTKARFRYGSSMKGFVEAAVEQRL